VLSRCRTDVAGPQGEGRSGTVLKHMLALGCLSYTERLG
jgi:hypothetical protein